MNSCLRGIHKAKYITNIGKVTGEAFTADNRIFRGDGYEEISVNWENDVDDVLSFTLNSYPNGCVRVTVEAINQINRELEIFKMLLYEESKEDNNPHHGNILIQRDHEDRIKRMTYSALAIKASKIIKST